MDEIPPKKNEFKKKDHMLAALTRATIKPKIMLKFWSKVPAISKVIGNDKNVLFKMGLGEIPWFHQVTFSIWPNAKTMAETIMSNGIDIVSNGTENHIVLVDLRSKGITGKDLERVLGSVNITVNKNSVPNDPASPFVTSGIRIGTPAATTRGFKEEEIIQVANWISDIINNFDNEELQKTIKEEVHKLTSNFPVYNL